MAPYTNHFDFYDASLTISLSSPDYDFAIKKDHHPQDDNRVGGTRTVSLATTTSAAEEEKDDDLSSSCHSRRRRRVSFEEQASYADTISRSEMTEKEQFLSWYNPTEMRQMKRTARHECRMFETNNLWESENATFRGLESRTMLGSNKKLRRRIDSYAAVFLEIECQFLDGYQCEETIADAYFVHTEECQKDAIKIAIMDENAVAAANNNDADSSPANPTDSTFPTVVSTTKTMNCAHAVVVNPLTPRPPQFPCSLYTCKL